MSKTIFVIFKNPADWDSSPEPIGFKTCSKEVEKFVNELKQTYRQHYKYYKSIWDAYGKTPFPTPPDTRPIIKQPRWPSGLSKKDITQEMIAERKAIEVANSEILKHNAKTLALATKERWEKVQQSLVGEEKEYFDEYFNWEEVTLPIYTKEFLEKDHEYYYTKIHEL